MSNSNGLYDFTAQIIDSDTGIVTMPDYECELDISWVRGNFTVDGVYIRHAGKLINLNNSIDPLTKRLVATISSQAETNDAFISEVNADYVEAA